MAEATHEKTHQEAVEKLDELIRDISIAMLTTQTPDGSLRSRPMQSHQDDKHFDGTIWFFTGANTGKVDEIQDDTHVNLSYAAPDKQRYVSVSGRASVVRDKDKAKELWNPAYKAWFPGGLDDPDLALLKIHVEAAEYWDTPGSAVVHLVGFVKAVATRQRYQPGENDKLEL